MKCSFEEVTLLHTNVGLWFFKFLFVRKVLRPFIICGHFVADRPPVFSISNFKHLSIFNSILSIVYYLLFYFFFFDKKKRQANQKVFISLSRSSQVSTPHLRYGYCTYWLLYSSKGKLIHQQRTDKKEGINQDPNQIVTY